MRYWVAIVDGNVVAEGASAREALGAGEALGYTRHQITLQAVSDEIRV